MKPAENSTFTLRGDTSPTTESITLLDFANTFAAKTNSIDVPDCHPLTARNICRWLDELLAAAEGEQAAEVARFARIITDRIADERARDAAESAKWGPFE